MPSYPRPPHGAIPLLGDTAVEALLAGNLSPEDTPAELRPLADAIAALSVTPAGHELAGEPAARAAYRSGFGRPARPARAHRRRNRVVGPVLSVKLAAAGVVAVGALTSAAYADVLPAPVQSLAHRTLDAPEPHRTTPPGHRGTPAGPVPAAPGMDGLCQAWAQAGAQGRAREEAVAFRRLAAAAGGAAQVKAYCAAAAHPGPSSPGRKVSHPQGKPSASSSSPAAGHPIGKSASHPDHPSPPTHPPPPSHPPPPGAKPTSLP